MDWERQRTPLRHSGQERERSQDREKGPISNLPTQSHPPASPSLVTSSSSFSNLAVRTKWNDPLSRSEENRQEEDQEDWECRSLDTFETIEQIGEGTFGLVYKAKDLTTGETVALKRIIIDKKSEGFPITALREIKILKTLDNPNVIKLKGIATNTRVSRYNSRWSNIGQICMVFEYQEHDLAGLICALNQHGEWFSESQIKCYIKQLLEGLHYCHSNNILHRDLKASNVFLNNKGELKVADFGLARIYDQQQENYTNRVVTLWYRPPELLLGSTVYDTSIDIWSAGCIFAELLTRHPLFPGKNELDELDLIFKLCGTPTEATWPNVTRLPWYSSMVTSSYKSRFREHFKNHPPAAVALIERMLCLDPAKRITAAEALEADYFRIHPLPAKPESLPVYAPTHGFVAKRRRAASAAGAAAGVAGLEGGQPSITMNQPISDTLGATKRYKADTANEAPSSSPGYRPDRKSVV